MIRIDIDLNRMECKAKSSRFLALASSDIDLNRMECKVGMYL